MPISQMFSPDVQRYEGVRPINIYLLRIVYFLIAAVVATNAWSTILSHEGPWDAYRALAMCVWAIYPSMAVLGVFQPLRMLPIMVFMIGYKALWLIVVALPLWQSGSLAGSPAERLAGTFLASQVAILVVPWGYVWRTYVMPARKRATA
jgi:hypothetical protein